MGTVIPFKANYNTFKFKQPKYSLLPDFTKEDLLIELNFVVAQLKEVFKDIIIDYELFNDSKCTFIYHMISINGVKCIGDFIFDMYLFSSMTDIQQLHEQLLPFLERLICQQWCSVIYKEIGKDE